jgi:hypothetical protein
MAEYSDPTISSFDVPEDTLMAPKRSTMTGKRPDLQPDQEFSPYSLDPTINAFDPMGAISQGMEFGGNEAPPPPPQGNYYVGQMLKKMFEARQGMQAFGLSAADIPASLPSQIGGAATYGLTRGLGGASDVRAHQLSEMVSEPLSYLQPGKVNQLFSPQENVIGQGSKAYEASPISQIMGLVTEYGAQPVIEHLMSRGMSQLDAEHLVSAGPLIAGGYLKLGQMAIKGVPKLNAWAKEAFPSEAPRTPIEPQMDVNQVPQSAGAAAVNKATTIRALAEDSHPEVQTKLKQMPAEDVNVDALLAHTLEKKHGINLTEGQRTDNVNLHTSEWNNRQAHPTTLGPLFENQPKQIFEALDRTKEQVAPDIFDSSPSQIGQHEINALATKDKVRTDAISDAYKKLTDANNGQFPIDVSTLNDNITNSLSNNLKTNHLSSAIKSDLGDFYKNPTFEGYEALRTNLANEMRSNSNGNARAAAYIVRDELEKLPVFGEETGSPQAIQLKQLADNARGLVRERYSVLNSNPAYKAAVKESGSLSDASSQGESLNAANFHKKFVTSATPEAVRRMKAEIPEGDIAHQAMAAGEIENLKRSSGYSGEGAPNNFTPTGNTKYLRDQSEKLLDIFGSEGRKNLTEINMLGNKIGQPKTGAFNYSNSTSSLIGEMLGKTAGTGLESLAAAHTHGASIPAIQIGKQWFQNAKNKKFGERAVNPTSGISYKD